MIKQGIDVSYAQGIIDWDKAKEAVDFAIIRAGYGKNNIDKQAKRNLSECNRLGIPCGVYWFSYAFTDYMARKEAEYCYNFIKDYKLEYPIYYDFEYDSENYAERTGHRLSPDDVCSMAMTFCEEIESHKYYTGIYTNRDYERRIYKTNSQVFKKYDKWLALYADTCDEAVHLWQFSNIGKIPGIEGNVDINEDRIDLARVIRRAGLNNLKGVK